MAAAGSGERLGAGGPKALVELAGRPLLDWSLDALRASQRIGPIVVAVPPGQEAQAQRDGVQVVAGGASRSESVAAAFAQLDAEIVVVHDAARPLVTAELVDAVIDDLLDDPDAGAVVAAAPVTDTIKQVLRGMEVDRTLDRSSLWAAQTPQAFRIDALREAIASTELLAQATDDAMLVERIGGRVLLHEAPAENVKVTTPLDLRVAELLLAQR
ncbi:MAG: 2-C-methyl-D-erythritol 4-phosphate cytidylyltransferase [Actinomycetota bacterium]|nr:2-C-methyl-D-erythritol 4-phosphate cytidylyltransferase [Actinomycetota bacterium]